MQYPKNNARRTPDYQNNIHAAARSERCNSYRNGCACGETPAVRPCDAEAAEPTPQMTESLAMAYIPYQEFRELYEPENALCAGTLFRELEKQFYGQRRRMA